ncbi:MAG TPA: DASS family sodium-coupled anion symporter [Flavisolibacter sp.]|nr:DASS family sodium-coupled anion symporter [Flavisolibacter sp.]
MPKLSNQLIALICVSLAVITYLINPFALAPDANKVIAFAVLMISLWVTEAIPMPVVALLPLILFPLFNIAPIDTTAASYANPVIFLFMGGFMLGLAIQKWNLHRRIALNIVQVTGTSGDRIILGFIISTGLISMWLSNTATTMMMFPIALSVVQVIRENHANQKGVANFSVAIMIGIALASNFGGIATIIGTPPNVAFAAFINKKFDYQISFFDWMKVGLPLSVLLLFILYLVMVKWLYPNRMKADDSTTFLIKNEVTALGKFSVAEKRVFVIFICTASLWITRELINKASGLRLDDNMIALIGAVALFITPSGKMGTALLEWSDTKNMAWGILLLFGGGIALATALEKAGLIQQLGQWFAQFAFSQLALIFLVTFISLFISEVMSNVAQVIVFAPVVASLAAAANVHPLILGIPMTLAASCASMLPMGTPPNAIAFSSGYIKLKQMTKVGFVMNIVSIILITLFCWLLLPLIFPQNI